MANLKKERVGFLLTGGSGMVGQALSAELRRSGLRVLQAIRGHAADAPDPASLGASGAGQVVWDPSAPQSFADPSVLEGLDVVVHLSGANLAGRRWTEAYKREIVNSRTITTGGLTRTLASLREPPRLLIVASATGIYGDRGDELLTEASAIGSGFLSETCAAWEESAKPAADAGIRVVHLRLGVVLARAGGALAKVLPLFRAGLGGRLGNGRQWMSWIAIDDLVGAVLHIAGYAADAAGKGAGESQPRALAIELQGPVNCISPVPVTNAEYTRSLAETLHRPAFAAAPAFALRLALGEMADEALLSSCRARPAKLLESGFAFRYPEIAPALAHLLRS